MIANVSGSFKHFTVTAETDGEDFSKVNNTIFIADVHSIDTGNEQRDTHLKSADFFNGEIHSLSFQKIPFRKSKI
jgi:polyisoprenoid-binding protein YceI